MRGPVTGMTIKLSMGQAGFGYISRPDGPGRERPGVLVLHEMWGLTPHIKDVADRFAAAGFVALAPDLWDGWTTTDFDQAYARFQALDVYETGERLCAATRTLIGQPDVDSSWRVGAIGFCLGGQLAMYVGTLMANYVRAVANFYGIHPRVVPDFSNLHAPVLGLFGERDPHVTPDVARALEREIKAAGKDVELVFYPADHAFFNDTRPDVYDEASAGDAWNRVLSFFHAHLRPA